MNITPLALLGVLRIQPTIFSDERGFFMESFNQRAFAKAAGFEANFVQDNHSKSAHGVLRGLHYQLAPHAQGKLVRVVVGEVFDVVVDIRRNSSTFAQWIGETLSAENKVQLWIPPGFAHGFVVQSESAEFMYKTTDYYAPESERVILWNDPALAINWPIKAPHLSPKDSVALKLREHTDLPT